MIKTLEDIAESLKNIKFRKQLLFGVDEADLWRKIQKLHEDYSQVINASEEKYKFALLEKENRIRALEDKIEELISDRGTP